MELMLVLTVMFVVLQLAGIIDWSWFLVLLPFIVGLIIHVALILIFYFVNKH